MSLLLTNQPANAKSLAMAFFNFLMTGILGAHSMKFRSTLIPAPLLTLTAALLVSCGDGSTETSHVMNDRTPPRPFPTPFPGRPLPFPKFMNPETASISGNVRFEKGTIRFGKKLKTISYQRYNSTSAVIEGDIIVPLRVILAPRNGVLENSPADPNGPDLYNRWPGGIVHYKIDPNLTNQQRVTDAIAHWEANTSLRFSRANSWQEDYITFQPHAKACNSSIGMINGNQVVNLANGCSTGNTIHEIGHAVGLWHEQTRFDRDNYVDINWENIKDNREDNFKEKSDYGFGGEDIGTYDFGSIMHYGSTYFSKNGRPTIVKKDGSLIAEQRVGLSGADIVQIETLYDGYIKGDCVGFNSNNLNVITRNGKYIIADGSHYLFAFDSRTQATQSMNILKAYNGRKSCFVGRPGPSMNYFLTAADSAPQGYVQGEDCISFNPATVRVENVNGQGRHYRIVSGDMWMLDFGDKRFEAGRALRVIRDLGFTKQCFVGRPGPAAFTYWRK